MATFSGQLRSNEIFSAMYNMIISQQVFADNIAGVEGSLVDKARVDGTLLGDTKLYYATDVLKSVAWGNDAEASNLLALHRPEAPECQAIVLDQFRQISLTVDDYLSKRAFADEGAFASFNAVMLGWVGETKRIYDATTYNVAIGTMKGTSAGQSRTIDVTTAVGDATGEEANRLAGQAIAEDLANLLVELKDISRDFNDYGNLRSYSEDEIKVIWNAKYLNKVLKIDLPTIFHKDSVMSKVTDVLPARYFGEVNGVSKTTADAKTRSLIEQDVGGAHYFPGDAIATGTTLVSGGAIVVPSYQEDEDIVCKVCVKLPPYMSAFEVGTSFFNAKSLTTNHYLTFGHNSIEYLKNYPMIEVKVA